MATGCGSRTGKPGHLVFFFDPRRAQRPAAVQWKSLRKLRRQLGRLRQLQRYRRPAENRTPQNRCELGDPRERRRHLGAGRYRRRRRGALPHHRQYVRRKHVERWGGPASITQKSPRIISRRQTGKRWTAKIWIWEGRKRCRSILQYPARLPRNG